MAKLAAFFKFLLISSILVCFLFLTYTRYYTEVLVNPDRKWLNKNGTKYILYWTGAKNFHIPNNHGYDVFQNCKYKNCFVTEDRSLLPLDEYDAIIFYIATSVNHPKEVIPVRRNPQQRYIFSNFETPLRFHDKNAQYVYNHFYNWTLTYRFDSDFVRAHGRIVKKKTKYVMPTKQHVLDKKGSVAWIVSNCNSVDKREELARNLAKHVKMDIYGKCGTLKCPDDEDCYDYVAKNYKFYLSFENSHCKDYMTEKFFKALDRDIIPVVYGGGDYANIAPERSYINVEDFDSTEILGSYLNILEQDLDSYLEYFQWKKDYVVEIGGGLTAMCKLCEMLNQPNAPPKVYEDIKYWWYSEVMSGCKTGEQLPAIVLEDD